MKKRNMLDRTKFLPELDTDLDASLITEDKEVFTPQPDQRKSINQKPRHKLKLYKPTAYRHSI